MAAHPVQHDALVEGTSEDATHVASRKRDKKTRKQEHKETSADPQGQDENAKAEKRKRRKAPVDQSDATEVREEAIEEESRKEKKHRRKASQGQSATVGRDAPDAGPSIISPHAAEGINEKKEKRRKHKRDRSSVDDEKSNFIAGPEDEAAAERKQSKDKKNWPHTKLEAATIQDESQPAEKTREKRKKRKKEAEGNEGTEPLTTSPPEGERKLKKKKRKHSKYGFSDPGEDESITDQAKKALCYAYAHAEEPEKWKFNKARQNWLIRNIWSEVAIPVGYVPLVNRYLTGMQGGVRQAFVKTCEGFAATTDGSPQAEPTNDAQSESTDGAAPETPLKSQRARELLQLLRKTEDD